MIPPLYEDAGEFYDGLAGPRQKWAPLRIYRSHG